MCCPYFKMKKNIKIEIKEMKYLDDIPKNVDLEKCLKESEGLPFERYKPVKKKM